VFFTIVAVVVTVAAIRSPVFFTGGTRTTPRPVRTLA
jgi:hypothetical protein